MSLIPVPLYRSKVRKKTLFDKLKKQKEFNILLEMGNICGGFPAACTSVTPTNKYNDVDVFFESESNLQSAVKSLNISRWQRQERYGVYTWNLDVGMPGFRTKYQLIEGYYGTAEEILNKFDITICQAVLDSNLECVWVTKDFARDNSSRLIRYINSNINRECNPFYFTYRLKKYVDKGYKIDWDCFLLTFGTFEKEHRETMMHDLIDEDVPPEDVKSKLMFIHNMAKL